MSDVEGDLTRRVQSGDEAALAEFLSARRAPLLTYIHRNLSDAMRAKVEADDIFQEVSTDAIRSYKELDWSDRDPFGWLCQIADRKIIDAHRYHFGAQKRDAARERSLDQGARGGGDSGGGGFIDLLINSLTTPSQAFSRNAREARLLHAISTLPEDQRDALHLRYVEDLPSKEIAKRLGKSDAAVRVMLTRSVRRLQDLMAAAE